jgi:hypothetical protein
MRNAASLLAPFAILYIAACSTFGQTIQPTEKTVEKAFPVTALVLAGQADGALAGVGTAVAVRENGVLLTAYHVVKNATALQVRFKNGDAYDDVQLLGVDARRDVAALRIAARSLPVLNVVEPERAKPGEAVIVISNAAALPWSVSSGIVAAVRPADEVPGAGNGYRLIQFTANIAPGSSGGALLDSQGNALGLIVGSLPRGQNLNFAVPIANVLGLADSPTTKAYSNGAALNLPGVANGRATVAHKEPEAAPDAPEKSDALRSSKDRDFILRNFKTMFVDARQARYFGSDQLKAELGRNKGFAALNIRIVDDPKLADVVLNVGYTFAWDYPFELKHQNTTTILLAGKGLGPFSGPAGAASVANEFVKIAKPYRPK